MQDHVKTKDRGEERMDDSDADAFAILAVLVIVYFAVTFYLNS